MHYFAKNKPHLQDFNYLYYTTMEYDFQGNFLLYAHNKHTLFFNVIRSLNFLIPPH